MYVCKDIKSCACYKEVQSVKFNYAFCNCKRFEHTWNICHWTLRRRQRYFKALYTIPINNNINFRLLFTLFVFIVCMYKPDTNDSEKNVWISFFTCDYTLKICYEFQCYKHCEIQKIFNLDILKSTMNYIR